MVKIGLVGMDLGLHATMWPFGGLGFGQRSSGVPSGQLFGSLGNKDEHGLGSSEVNDEKTKEQFSGDGNNVGCLVTSSMPLPPLPFARASGEFLLGSRARPIVVEDDSEEEPLEDPPEDSKEVTLDDNLYYLKMLLEKMTIVKPLNEEPSITSYHSSHTMHTGNFVFWRVSKLRVNLLGRSNSRSSKRKGADVQMMLQLQS